MKKMILSLFSIMLLMFSLNVVTYASNKTINAVKVTEIDTPYTNQRVLDTKGAVPNDAKYRITEISWNVPKTSSSGFYEVTVTLEANIGYEFSTDVVATINEKSISSKIVKGNDKETLVLTYIFKDEVSSIGSATTTLRHRIFTYCDKEMGTVTPNTPRVLHGDTVTIYIQPKDGFEIKDVVVDGESVGEVSEYEFKKVKEEHVIRAYFKEVEKEEKSDDEIKADKPLFNFIKVLFGLK